MVENKRLSNDPETTEDSQSGIVGEDEKAVKLLSQILEANVLEIKPQLDYASESGFVYPFAEQILGIKGTEVAYILEALVNR